jgi:hypothetical protein
MEGNSSSSHLTSIYQCECRFNNRITMGLDVSTTGSLQKHRQMTLSGVVVQAFQSHRQGRWSFAVSHRDECSLLLQLGDDKASDLFITEECHSYFHPILVDFSDSQTFSPTLGVFAWTAFILGRFGDPVVSQPANAYSSIARNTAPRKRVDGDGSVAMDRQPWA